MNSEPQNLQHINNYPEFLKPRLRLFLSADIAGSTAAKQKESSFYKEGEAPRKERGWMEATVYFFEEFSSQFEAAWALADNAYHSVSGTKKSKNNPPEYWKAIGDEILFYKEISQWEEIWIAIGAWSVAIKKVRHELHNKFNSLGLDIKGTAWIAGFPVINTELVLNIKSTPNSAEYKPQIDFPIFSNICNLDQYYKSLSAGRHPAGERDFIGPLIDAGFRVSSQAIPGRLVISIEAAYAILANKLKHGHVKAIQEEVKEFPDFKLYYAGRKHLKGFSGSSGYPLFIVDIGLPDDDLFSSEAKLLTKTNTCNMVNEQEALDFCEKYFHDGTSVCHPYIYDEVDSILLGGQMPQGHLMRLSELHDLWIKISANALSSPVKVSLSDNETEPENIGIDKITDLAGLPARTQI